MSTIDKAEEQALGGHHKFGTTLRHASVDERLNAGKQARSTVPRSSHAALPAAGDRPDPVTLLEEQAASRVQSLVPIRYGRMLSSPFAFYRGAARIMASDLAGTPNSGLHVQLCGDAHLSNFGMFASPERQLVFGLNDFDETLPGPWEWDVKRLAASLEVAGRENGYTDKERTDDPAKVGGQLPPCTARVRHHDQPGRVVFTPRGRRSGRDPSQSGRSEAARGPGEKSLQDAHPRQHARLLQADRGGRRRAADHQRPAADPAGPRHPPRCARARR